MSARVMDRAIAVGATVSALYFSFIPLLSVSSLLGVGRLALFAILTAGVCLLILHRLVKSRDEGFEWRSIVALQFYLVFAAYAALRFLVEPPSPEGLSTLRALLVVNPLFILFALNARAERDLIIKVLFALSAFYVLLLLIALFNGPWTELAANVFRLLGIEGLFYQNISHYIGLFVVSSLYFIRVSGAWRWPILAILIGSLLGMLMVGGRASFVAVVIVITIHFLYGMPTVRMTRWHRHVLVALVLSGLVSIALYSVRQENVVESVMLVKQFSMLLKAIDTSLRLFLFSSALGLWLTDAVTVFFGAGIGSFPVSIGQSGAGWYPHNIVLELLAEYGAVGFILFFLPVAYLAVTWWRVRQQSGERDPAEWIAMLIAVYLLVQANFSGGLSTSWVFLYFVYLILPAARHSAESEVGVSMRRAAENGPVHIDDSAQANRSTS